MKQLVTTDWLNKNLDRVKILDASWHLPNTNRDALKEVNNYGANINQHNKIQTT